MSAFVESSLAKNTGWWFEAKTGDEPMLGAYIPESDDELTIYWVGTPRSSHIRIIIGQVEKMLQENGGGFQGTLFAYDTTKEVIGPVFQGLSDCLAPDSKLSEFAAYRAELTGQAGKVVVWANIRNGTGMDLARGGNIGIGVSHGLFDGPARPVLIGAIQSTTSLGDNITKYLLGQIASALPRNHLH
jgi:hypothetical protein